MVFEFIYLKGEITKEGDNPLVSKLMSLHRLKHLNTDRNTGGKQTHTLIIIAECNYPTCFDFPGVRP
jgi:hypothetical protein